MKKLFILSLVLMLTLSLLAGCGKKSTFISEEKAIAIAMETAGVTKQQVTDAHTHAGNYDGKTCYSIHIYTNDKEFEIVIDARTGDVLAETNDR